jgi:dTDP-4-dehydrorhamnose 3,5-epimerase
VIFREAGLAGAWLIDIEPQEDERGFFGRTFSRDDFAARGLKADFLQCSLSYNRRSGTLRGMHYQAPPHAENKLVRCTMGAVLDVIVDLRPGSPTFLRWVQFELSAENRRSLYVPELCAHGFMTLSDDTEVSYQITEYHHPESARGARWNDPLLGIRWPREPAVISARDQAHPLLDPSLSSGG